jgi:hypothetical protein
MKHMTFNPDGSVIIHKSFFDEVMEVNEILDLTLVIEKRAGQINFLGTKIKRQPK